MKRLYRLFALTLTFGLVAACGNSNEPVQVTVDDLVGTWTASRFQITDESGTIAPFDIVAFGGRLVITVTSGGGFSGTLKASAIATENPVSGTVTVQGMTLTLTFTQGLVQPISGQFVLSGDTLTISGSGLTIEFEGQTIGAASIVLVLRR
ncbi:MAG: lipocalin family protein [Gemmatimonadota bacterium]|nr:lipocalin family protein [Gemmatimonadota bacterium]MDH3369105.1 lipocalin family protein [Gemmatimonadota bacterium]MDH3477945.1 lipocalin family protein [Gemmatimonadota bacterium]MDH3571014.1 lipocalin family protein [Gemmatimonadota bacterium]MDH5549405.1 lipocalin family protein [Gemmatimonadota bacterium]